MPLSLLEAAWNTVQACIGHWRHRANIPGARVATVQAASVLRRFAIEIVMGAFQLCEAGHAAPVWQ
jgi:hypothetical protein